MKISQLIKELEKKKEEFGDIDVVVNDELNSRYMRVFQTKFQEKAGISNRRDDGVWYVEIKSCLILADRFFKDTRIGKLLEELNRS